MVVLDTCALIWYTLDPDSLSKKASDAIDNADEAVVSAISIWEMSVKIAKGNLEIPIPLRSYVNRLENVHDIRIAPVDHGTTLDTADLRWDHRDPADRIIVATALRLGLPLVTDDRKIRQFYKRTVW